MATGRQRLFDTEQALDAAMLSFWKNGYAGTSIASLTTAMGINKPSMYAAFGNKEQLFLTVVERYVQKHGFPHAEKLMQGSQSLKARVRLYLSSIAEMLINSHLPGGCFVANSSCEYGGNHLPEKAAQAIKLINDNTQSGLLAFFQHEQQTGNLSSKISAEGLVSYLQAISNGMAVMARGGASTNELESIINVAIEIL